MAVLVCLFLWFPMWSVVALSHFLPHPPSLPPSLPLSLSPSLPFSLSLSPSLLLSPSPSPSSSLSLLTGTSMTGRNCKSSFQNWTKSPSKWEPKRRAGKERCVVWVPTLGESCSLYVHVHCTCTCRCILFAVGTTYLHLLVCTMY